MDISEDVHARLKMIAPAEGKEDLTLTYPDEQTLLEMPKDIRKGEQRTG